ncbi:hypothetical protein [Streptomyces sp. NPDC008265]|uniref:hypothetical protein n=1 Tax=Streptomyces sp. NPDC008265 TaxID=3364824 RepID=UPI0036E94EEB
MTDTTALALAAVVAAVPLAVWAARLAPRRRARTARADRLAAARADRELWRLIRSRCPHPATCPTCTTHAHRAE